MLQECYGAKRAALVGSDLTFLVVRVEKEALKQNRKTTSWKGLSLKRHQEVQMTTYILLWQMSRMTLGSPFTHLASVSPHQTLSIHTLPECPHGLIWLKILPS